MANEKGWSYDDARWWIALSSAGDHCHFGLEEARAFEVGTRSSWHDTCVTRGASTAGTSASGAFTPTIFVIAHRREDSRRLTSIGSVESNGLTGWGARQKVRRRGK